MPLPYAFKRIFSDKVGLDIWSFAIACAYMVMVAVQVVKVDERGREVTSEQLSTIIAHAGDTVESPFSRLFLITYNCNKHTFRSLAHHHLIIFHGHHSRGSLYLRMAT